MPGKVKVRIVAARDLPVMDRSSDLADAFAEIRLGNVTHRTEVCKKSLNPQWNSEWFRFEVDDEELQDEPLQIRIMDHDTVTAHDAIGKVTLSLSPLLTQDAPSSISGWFPIYDTMHGIRGEVQVIVKVDFFLDFNKFRQTSCGVKFFYSCGIPVCYKSLAIHGFVEELVVNDDPEYQWIDKIRTPRASNEARLRLFTKLSGELQRKIGLKVLETGGNAVLGYRQCFDLEGEFGIVVRGIGTSVTLARLPSTPPGTPTNPSSLSGEMGASQCQESGFVFPDTPTHGVQTTPIKSQAGARRYRKSSSESEHGSVSPPRERSVTMTYMAGSGGGDSGGGSLPGAQTSLASRTLWQAQQMRNKSVEDLEFPFFTLTRFSPGFLRSIGGVVTARSVRLLDKINNPDEPETRDAWWTEVRTEIRSHARAMGCHAVIGYYESTSICDELIVLSATGTAACVNLQYGDPGVPGTLATMVARQTLGLGSFQGQTDVDQPLQRVMENSPESLVQPDGTPSPEDKLSYSPPPGCSVCHVPYIDRDIPFPINLTKCQVCRYRKVPDVLFSTIEAPPELQVTGTGCLLQARVCRTKKKEKGEANADIVSSMLPFLEYELHQQLINKLKVLGMNSLFGLHVQISIGEAIIVGTASATAMFLSALPPPPFLRIHGKRGTPEEDKRLREMQKQILETTTKNRLRYMLNDSVVPGLTPPASPLQEGSTIVADFDHEPNNELDLCNGGKDAYVVEIDDKKDEDIVTVLLDSPTPQGYYCCNTEAFPGLLPLQRSVQMVTSVQRHTLSHEDVRTNEQFAKMFEDTMRNLWFKLRHMAPCCLFNVRFDVEIPEDDNIQVAVTGVAVKVDDSSFDPEKSFNMGKCPKDSHSTRKSGESHSLKGQRVDSDDLMFPIDEVSASNVTEMKGSVVGPKLNLENRLPFKKENTSVYCPSVEVTPMSYLPKAQIETYLGHINLFFIRESHTVRENGGLNVFMQVFLAEAQAVLRAHVLSLGGNALVSYQLNELILLDNPHKHQGQCLLNVSGDAVEVSYDGETGLSDSFNRSPKRYRSSTYTDAQTQPLLRIMRQRSISESPCGEDPYNDPSHGTEI